VSIKSYLFLVGTKSWQIDLYFCSSLLQSKSIKKYRFDASLLLLLQLTTTQQKLGAAVLSHFLHLPKKMQQAREKEQGSDTPALATGRPPKCRGNTTPDVIHVSSLQNYCRRRHWHQSLRHYHIRPSGTCGKQGFSHPSIATSALWIPTLLEERSARQGTAWHGSVSICSM